MHAVTLISIYLGFGDAVSVLPIYTGGGVAGMPYKCIAQVPGQKLEDAPSLSDYVSLVHFSCKSLCINQTACVYIVHILYSTLSISKKSNSISKCYSDKIYYEITVV